MPTNDKKAEEVICCPGLEVIDETEFDLTVAPIKYEISSYGADFDIEGLVKRLDRGDIFIPHFQRAYVWTQREASRFIESVLLGLPVPGIFLAKEASSKRLLVIDGQQRLKTLAFFFGGFFNPGEEAKFKRVFKLQGVQERFEDKTYKTLVNEDRLILNDSVLHATIVKQESPQGESSCYYDIFERLNTTGRKLSPQQIRVAIYHGFLIDLLHSLNSSPAWRKVFGPKSKTLKDEELILRFLSLYYFADKYSAPMKDFLNDATQDILKTGSEIAAELENRFIKTIEFIFDALGSDAFKLERAINAAVFDSVMVGTAHRLASAPAPSSSQYRKAYESLLNSQDYIGLVSKATANERNVARRLETAGAAFKRLEPIK